MATKFTTATKTKLRNTYGAWASTILALNGYLETLPRAKGAQQKWKVKKPLPSIAEFNKLRAAHFTTTVSSLVTDAFSAVQELKDELQDWYDNLPEAFQQGDKGSQLEDAIGTLDQVSEPDVDEKLENITILHIPSDKPPPARHAWPKSPTCSIPSLARWRKT